MLHGVCLLRAASPVTRWARGVFSYKPRHTFLTYALSQPLATMAEGHGFKGISFMKSHKKWRSHLKVKSRMIHNGLHPTAEEAAHHTDMWAVAGGGGQGGKAAAISCFAAHVCCP